MKKSWSIVLILLVILLMGFSFLNSANTGISFESIVENSFIVNKIESMLNTASRRMGFI